MKRYWSLQIWTDDYCQPYIDHCLRPQIRDAERGAWFVARLQEAHAYNMCVMVHHFEEGLTCSGAIGLYELERYPLSELVTGLNTNSQTKLLERIADMDLSGLTLQTIKTMFQMIIDEANAALSAPPSFFIDFTDEYEAQELPAIEDVQRLTKPLANIQPGAWVFVPNMQRKREIKRVERRDSGTWVGVNISTTERDMVVFHKVEIIANLNQSVEENAA